MPRRTCSVCSDARREEIDRAIHRGLYTSEIARRFGLTNPTIAGHRRSAHHLLHPRRVAGGPHNAASLLRRIVDRLDDDEALRDLRVAVSTLPPAERTILLEALRRRAGRSKVGALRSAA